MSYTLRLDQSELFEAKINVKGAKLSDSECRLILLSDDWNLMFEGTVDQNGYVEIPIKKLKKILSEGDSGRLRLEVIVDDTYFIPWNDTFEVVLGRQVTAEVRSSSKKGLSEKKVQMTASLIKPAKKSSSNALTIDRKSTRLNSSHSQQSRMPSSA